MIKPSRKVAALVVTAGLMLSSVAVSAGDSVVILNQSNVGISAAVDRYVEATADTEATTAVASKDSSKTSLSASSEKSSKDVKDTKETEKKEVGSKAAEVKSEDKQEDKTEAESLTFEEISGKAIVIADDSLNVRKTPSMDGEIIGELPTGTVCEVTKKTSGWTYIIADGVEGFVFSNYLKFGDDATKWAESYTGKVAVITGEGLRLRSEADINSDVLTYLPQGQTYKVLDYAGDWTKIEIDADLQGYVSNEFIEVVDKGDDDAIYAIRVKLFEENTGKTEETTEEVTTEATQEEVTEAETNEVVTEPETEEETEEETTTVEETEEETEEVTEAPAEVPYSSKGEEVVAYAVQFVGNPYVYGGSSLTDGADCSGFTMAVYAHFGYSLPHGSNPQAYCGVEVPLDSIMPGDLLFYESPGGYGHVTIYMGGGQVVHASTEETGIKISPYDYREPAKAVRIIY